MPVNIQKPFLPGMPFFIKLVLFQGGVFVLVVVVLFLFADRMTSTYNQELIQKLNKDLAQYIVDHGKEPLIDDRGEPNQKALKSLAMHTMMINPMVEVYLLDNEGMILGHAIPTNEVVMGQVDINILEQVLNSNSGKLSTGPNPRFQDKRSIFSTARVYSISRDFSGYLYVILTSEYSSRIQQDLYDSYTLKLVFVALAVVLVLMVISTTVYLAIITLPLKKLSSNVRAFCSDTDISSQKYRHLLSRDEIQDLCYAFEAMKERILDQISEIEKTDSDRRELISNISHDLRTPLASIHGYIESILIKDRELNEEQKLSYLHTALSNCMKLNRLISQLFKLSKLDTSGITIHPECFSLSELASDMVQSFSLQAERKGIHLCTDIDENYCVKGDIHLVNQVFQNLIENALHFTPKGGEVDVELSTQSDGVVVKVKDTGLGIAEDIKDKIFENYFTSSKAANSERAGTGLGLAIVKRILDLHESEIKVESSLGQGSTFYFVLPRITYP